MPFRRHLNEPHQYRSEHDRWFIIDENDSPAAHTSLHLFAPRALLHEAL